jgi:hypothetical protein
VTTFHELYQKVKDTDKIHKNSNKLSLKQLEVKKKERLIGNDEMDHNQFIDMNKFGTKQLFDSSKLFLFKS